MSCRGRLQAPAGAQHGSKRKREAVEEEAEGVVDGGAGGGGSGAGVDDDVVLDEEALQRLLEEAEKVRPMLPTPLCLPTCT